MSDASAHVEITDPTRATSKGPAWLDQRLLALIDDERDLVFGHLWLQATFVLVPCAVALFLYRDFPILLGFAYLALLFLVFVDRFILAAHNTSHRRFWKKGYEWLHLPVTFVLGPLHGHTPFTYFGHHVGMHHVEENLKDDLSSTMRFRRDGFFDFLAYFLRFFCFCGVELPLYFLKKRRYRLMRQVFLGELSYLVAVFFLARYHFQATLFVFIIPYCMVRFLMMAGNWAQHAFIDPSAPHDPYKSSITCLNTRYNRRCFNDGYHIGHHLHPTMHWTEMPLDYQRTLGEYAKNNAIIFNGIDYFEIWVLLMLKQKKRLAKYYVPLNGPMTTEQILALFEARLQPCPNAPEVIAEQA